MTSSGSTTSQSHRQADSLTKLNRPIGGLTNRRMDGRIQSESSSSMKLRKARKEFFVSNRESENSANNLWVVADWLNIASVLYENFISLRFKLCLLFALRRRGSWRQATVSRAFDDRDMGRNCLQVLPTITSQSDRFE